MPGRSTGELPAGVYNETKLTVNLGNTVYTFFFKSSTCVKYNVQQCVQYNVLQSS